LKGCHYWFLKKNCVCTWLILCCIFISGVAIWLKSFNTYRFMWNTEISKWNKNMYLIQWNKFVYFIVWVWRHIVITDVVTVKISLSVRNENYCNPHQNSLLNLPIFIWTSTSEFIAKPACIHMNLYIRIHC
jgi:hypothetical protein